MYYLFHSCRIPATLNLGLDSIEPALDREILEMVLYRLEKKDISSMEAYGS